MAGYGLHRILQRQLMGLFTCDVVSVDVVALRPSWQCVDGATSHCYEAEMKTTFTLHEVCLDVARLGHLPKHFVLSGGWHEVMPFSEVCRACLCPHSLGDQSDRNLGYSHAFLRVRGLPLAACLLLWWSLRVTTPRLRSHGLIFGSLDSLGVLTHWR